MIVGVQIGDQSPWLTRIYLRAETEGDAKGNEAARSHDFAFITSDPAREVEYEGEKAGENTVIKEINIRQRHEGAVVVSLVDLTGYKLHIKSLEFFTPNKLPPRGKKDVFPARSYPLSNDGLKILKEAVKAITAKDRAHCVAYDQFKIIQQILSNEREAIPVVGEKADSKQEKVPLKRAGTEKWVSPVTNKLTDG